MTTMATAVRAQLSPWSPQSIGHYLTSNAQLISAEASGTGTADLVYYVPIQLSRAYTALKVFWLNGAAAANGTVEVGVYNEAFGKVVSCTATTTSGTTAVQTVDIADTTLTAGTRYYMAFVSHHATDAFRRLTPAAGILQAGGVMQQGSQASLPSTATPVAMATAYIPVFGLSGQTVY